MIIPSPTELRHLARYRHAIRKFLRAGEEAARRAGLTPQHHQLLLGVAGFTRKGTATLTELAEFLQVRHHSAVGLVDRAASLGLVRREDKSEDHREVQVVLTADGARKLRSLDALHRRQLSALRRMELFRLEERAAPERARARPAKRKKRG